jgi:AraC-like DNA-binding protein
VADIFQNRDGKLWIATDGGGVYIYDLKTNKVTHQLTTENGLPTNSVTSITRDQTGRIWIGTEKGLVFVNPERPTDIINVSYCYGLNTEYVQHAVANLPNGDIIYGTVDGAVIINPKNITRLNYQARLTIKGVRVHDDADAEYKDLDKFRRKIAEGLLMGKIKLSYNQRSFDILFESINMRNYFDVAYQYKMEGMEWSQVITQQFLGFENLEPGKHILYIRSISKTSGIALDERKITIYIGQPWWNSWWMWCIYIILLVLTFQGLWWMYNLHNKYLRLMMEKVALPEEKSHSPLPTENGAPSHDGKSPLKEDSESQETADNEADSEPVKTEGVEFVGMATKLTLDNLKDTDFTIDDLCREMGMSRTLFYVKLKTYTGKSPQDFVRAIRLEKAANLLRQGRSVTEVSVLTGFDNPKYFSTVFKKYFGVSPSKYE